MSSNSINSRMAAQRSHSLTRRWTCGSGIRRRSGRRGKNGPRASSHLALLALPPFQPDQKTIAQHDGDGVPMKAIPAPSLILIPAQLGFGFFMILLDPMAAMGILDHPGQRRGRRKITPAILPVPMLAPSGTLSNQPAHMAAAITIHPPAAQCHKLGPPPALGPPARHAMVCQSRRGCAASTASARCTGLAGPRPRVTLKLARTATTWRSPRCSRPLRKWGLSP
jgi:hypothetical protein